MSEPQQITPPAGAPVLPPDEAELIDRLVAAGKCKQAVELAKEHHKRLRTPQSEQRLVDAYVSRIEQFLSKGSIPEAQALLGLVQDRFPSHRPRLMTLESPLLAASGKIERLLAPLAQPNLPPETRQRIDEAIRRFVTDLPALANCPLLPAEHSLRQEAAAIWRAFEATTSGPVTDEQVALPQVPRRSPLAGWKLLIRAIVAFYREQDEDCKRALDAIPPDAAVRRVANALLAMLGAPPSLVGPAAVLRTRVLSNPNSLREAIQGLERALEVEDLPRLKGAIRNVIRTCSGIAPEVCARLRQHISIGCLIRDIPPQAVLEAMGSPKRDAYFWRLLARADELLEAPAVAALHWERFLAHAIDEGLVTSGSLEAGMVYLHAAELISSLSLDELARMRRHLAESGVVEDYYIDQAPEIAALAPPSEARLVEIVLSPGWLFEQAAKCHPAVETFQQWWSWAQRIELPVRSKEQIARLWHLKLPKDPQPLLILSDLAEQRGALKMALTSLTEAEALDSLNPQVRKARLRLTLATAWRHFKDRKPHLIDNDLTALEALPGMREGDRGAVLAALRAAWHALREDAAARQLHAEQVMAQLSPLAGHVVLESVADMAGLARAGPPIPCGSALPDPHEVVRAEARLDHLAYDLRLRIVRPTNWDPIINDVLRERTCPLSHSQLLAMGRAALARQNLPQAYLVSAAGLRNASGPTAARFLLLRAQSLTAPWAQKRSAQCLRAALELARQTHDAELLGDVFDTIDRHGLARYAIRSARSGHALGDELLAEVLKSERQAINFPHDALDANRHLVTIESATENRGFFDDDESPEIDDEAPDDDFAFPGAPPSIEDLPPELVQELTRAFARSGGRPPSVEDLMRTNPRLLIQLMTAMSGMDQAAIGELMDHLDDQPRENSPFFGRRRKRHRKRRRR